LHKDLFDRMLICQAIIGGLTLLTPDPLIKQYAVATAW
jgi:PIN domain nuclease of toxin-antitoxin system